MKITEYTEKAKYWLYKPVKLVVFLI